MNVEERKKRIKHRLIDLGISFREWCRQQEFSHSVARDIVNGRLDGSRSEHNLQIKKKLEEVFGADIFD